MDYLDVDSHCNDVESLPDITFVLDGKKYPLTGKEYTMTITDDGTANTVENMEEKGMSTRNMDCGGAFMPLDIPEKETAWILVFF